MERRDVIRAGLAVGTTFFGTRILSPDAAEARAVKPARLVFNGSMGTESADWRLRLAIVRNRFIGFGSPFDHDGADPAMLGILGGVKKGKLKGSVYVVLDPLDRVPENTLVGKFSGAVKDKTLRGTLALPDFPGAGEPGSAYAPQVAEDKKAMREMAGIYAGEITGGLPKFKAEATLSANGSFELAKIFKEDGTPVAGRRGGVFFLGEPFNPTTWDRLIFAFPLPSRRAEGSSLAGKGLGILDSSCCEDNSLEITKWIAKGATTAVGTASKPQGQPGNVNVSVGNPFSREGCYMEITGKPPPR